MQELTVTTHDAYAAHSLTLRDVVAIAFRHRRLILLSFFGVLAGAILTVVLQPNRYDASMKILVKRNRVDPIVAPEVTAAPQASAVTEEELNSEVELLKSRDLLEKVVLACDLQHPKRSAPFRILVGLIPPSGARSKPAKGCLPSSTTSIPCATPPALTVATDGQQVRPPAAQLSSVQVSGANFRNSGHPFNGDTATPTPMSGKETRRTPEEAIRIASAVRKLEKELKVEVVKRTNLIGVSYESADPQLAARVLTTLANLYLEKHVTVHRSAGAFDFFQKETERYRNGLAEAETRLADFNQRVGVVSAAQEKEVALQKVADFQVTLSQTEAAIAENQQRIRLLEEQSVSLPTRMVTQVRNADDGPLLSQLRSNLLTLEQKRTELLGKFEPTYRPVQEIEAQMAQTRDALASAEKSKLHDEVTDRDPTYEWTRGELAKTKTDLVGLQARAKATAQNVRWYQENARSLDQKGIIQGSLIRTVKEAEENYVLYLRKEEESRISDALDRGGILNVAVAEAATVPSLSSSHSSTTILFGALLAVFVSFGSVFISERLDSTFRTPEEVKLILDVPVLAAIPAPGENGAAIDRSIHDFRERQQSEAIA